MSVTPVPYSDEDLRRLYSNFDHKRQFFDSTLLKVLNASLIPRMVELIEIKNHYKIANIIGRLIDIALLVAGVASGILPWVGLAMAVVCFKVIVIGFDIYNVLGNKRIIQNFQENGIPYNRYMDLR